MFYLLGLYPGYESVHYFWEFYFAIAIVLVLVFLARYIRHVDFQLV